MSPTELLRALALTGLASCGLAGCASSVHGAATTSDAAVDAAVADAPVADAPVADAPAAPEFEPCASIEATCVGEPRRLYRATATGLTDVDGGRVQVVVRYLDRGDSDLQGPRGVALGGATVRGGAFTACACVPRNANGYPQVAAVVFAAGSRGETSRDVRRAFFQQRFAIVGDDDVSFALREAPRVEVVEAALAAMDPRRVEAAVTGFDASHEGLRAFAGVVSDERPVAAEVAYGAVVDATLRLTWTRPGRAWPSERVAVVLDRNENSECDTDDLGAWVVRDAAGATSVTPATLLRGASLGALCDALRVGAPRD